MHAYVSAYVSAYREENKKMVVWSDVNNLELNISKTKEMIIDFRRNATTSVPLILEDDMVKTVEHFKFLSLTISNTLRWDENTKLITKTAQQRMYFLRQLKKFGINRDILTQFYRAVIESVLTFSITVWYGSTTQAEKNSLDRVIRTASQIIGRQLPSLESIYAARTVQKTKHILADQQHPANQLFHSLP